MPEAEQKEGGIRRIQVDDSGRLPDWVHEPGAEPSEDDEAADELSYEEWEALYEEQEYGKPEPEEPEEPPEPEMAAPLPPGMPEPPMPDMGGMPGDQAQDEADIPDWAKSTSFETTIVYFGTLPVATGLKPVTPEPLNRCW